MCDLNAAEATGTAARRCAVCGEIIPAEAKLCSKCSNYQNAWRRSFGGLSSALAAIAAVLPILAIGLAAWRLVFPPPADLQFTELICSSDSLQMAVSNVGETIGVIESAAFEVLREPALPNKSSNARSVFTDVPIAPLRPNDVFAVTYHGKLDGKPTPFPVSGDSRSCLYQLTTTTVAMVHTITGSAVQRKQEKHQCSCPQ